MSEITANTNVFILTLTWDEEGSHATIFKTYEEAEAALHNWCRERWAAAMDDEGAEWEHGATPADDQEMYTEFRDWASERDWDWQIYRDVPLPE